MAGDRAVAVAALGLFHKSLGNFWRSPDSEAEAPPKADADQEKSTPFHKQCWMRREKNQIDF